MPAASPLTDPPVASVAEAIQRMQAIQAQLAADAVLTATHTEVLDRFVGFAGRGLLIPLI